MSVSSYQLSQQLRRQGAEAEERFIAATIVAYEDAIDALGDEIEALTSRIAELDDPSLSQITALERFRSLQSQLTDEYERIVRAGTFPQIEALAAEAIVIGRDGADAQFASYGIEGYASLGNAEMLALLEDVIADGNIGKAVNAIPAGARDDVLRSLMSALVLGQGPAATARALQQQLKDRSRADIETLARTTQMGAQRKASIEHYNRNSDVLDGWIWMAALGSSPLPCLACMAQHGTVHPLSEEMVSHPNCFPAGTLVSGPKVVGSTERWYSGPVVEIETAGGHRLTSTVNHPILTPEGWIAAGSLNEGGYVISSGFQERPFAAVNPDDYQVPALIEDVAQTFGRASGVFPVRMPTAAEDFHGDGVGSNVHVVRTNGLLRDAVNATIKQPALQQAFSGRDMKLLPLIGHSPFALLLKGLDARSRYLVGSSGVAPVLVGCPVCHHQAVGLKDRTSRDTGLFQPSQDDGTRRAQTLRNRVLGFAGKITGRNRPNINGDVRTVVAEGDVVLNEHPVNDLLGHAIPTPESFARFTADVFQDQIVEIRRSPFTGHVYNLQTTEQWYNANGIIVHNCRCTAAPRVINTRVEILTGDEWFRSLNEAQQRARLGPARFKLWQEGRFQVVDLISHGSGKYGAFMSVTPARNL